MRDWCLRQFVIFDIARDADDFEWRHASAEPKPFTQRALARKEPPRHRFINDHHAGRSRTIQLGEPTPHNNSDPHRFVIARADEVHIEGHMFFGQWLASFDEETVHISASTEWRSKCVTNSLSARKYHEALDQLLLQLAPARLVVSLLVQFELRDQHVRCLKTGIDRKQIAQAFDAQPCTA